MSNRVERARSAWDREYREVHAYTTSYRGDLDRGVHFLLQYAAARGESLAEPLVDLGCGRGRNLLPLLAAGRDVVGIDHSAEALARLRTAAGERGLAGRLRLLRHDLGQPLPLVDGSAGTVLDVTAVDNLVDEERLSLYGREVGRILRPGGLALVVTFAVDDGYYAPFLERRVAGEPVVEDPHTGIRNRLFTRGSLDRVFAPALVREVGATLVFHDRAADRSWTRRFPMHLYRKPGSGEGRPPPR